MPNMTLSIPEEIYHIVKSYNEIRWSEIARKAIADYAKKLALMEAMLAENKVTEEDVMKLDKKIKKWIHKHYLELLKNKTGSPNNDKSSNKNYQNNYKQDIISFFIFKI